MPAGGTCLASVGGEEDTAGGAGEAREKRRPGGERRAYSAREELFIHSAPPV